MTVPAGYTPGPAPTVGRIVLYHPRHARPGTWWAAIVTYVYGCPISDGHVDLVAFPPMSGGYVAGNVAQLAADVHPDDADLAWRWPPRA